MSIPVRPARLACFVAALLLAGSLPGCKPAREGALKLEAAPANTPSIADIAAIHNQRVAQLATTFSHGVIEIRWRDDRGKHHARGDLDFYRTTGSRTALRVSKVGEVRLWLGSNEREFWLFDLVNDDERVLHRGPHDVQAAGPGAAGAVDAFGVRPLALLDLLALTPIAGSATDDPQRPLYDRRRKALVMEFGAPEANSSRTRLFVDRTSLLPVRVELLNEQGGVIAEATHARYATVEMEGVAVPARPKMATLIDIRPGPASSAGDDGQTAGRWDGEVKIAINSTTTVVDDKTLRNVFDLDRLIKAMRPDRIDVAGADE